MCQVKLSSSEVPKIVALVEQLFPGVDMAPLVKAMSGITADGAVTLTKTIAANDSFIVALTITPD